MTHTFNHRSLSPGLAMLAAAGLVLALSGCGRADSGSPNGGGGNGSSDETTLVQPLPDQGASRGDSVVYDDDDEPDLDESSEQGGRSAGDLIDDGVERLLAQRVEVAVEMPSGGSPVASAAAIWPREVAPGERAVVVVAVRTAMTWHIYPPDLDPSSPYIPATISLSLPPHIRQIGDVVSPEAHHDPIANAPVLEGDFQFRMIIEIADDAPAGPATVQANFGWQACDPQMCLPPGQKSLTATLTITDNAADGSR